MIYYVSNSGNDANDGSQATQGTGTIGPLATMQEAVNRMSAGSHNIQLVNDLPPGQEASFAPVNIAHFLNIGINGDSNDWTRCKIVATGSNIGAWVQDHATAGFQYVTFEGRAVGARQYAIADVASCIFRGGAAGPILYAAENARINGIGELQIKGGGSNFAWATGPASEISLNTILKYDHVAFTDSNVRADKRGKITMYGANIAQNLFPTGKQWNIGQQGVLDKGGVIIPGSINGANFDGTGVIW